MSGRFFFIISKLIIFLIYFRLQTNIHRSRMSRSSFNSFAFDSNIPVAEPAEHGASNIKVMGSIPGECMNLKDV